MESLMESCPSHAKNNISPLPQRIWPPNMATTTHMATKHGYHNANGYQTWLPQPNGHQTCLGDDLPRHIYGHQTWLGNDLPQRIYGIYDHQTWPGDDLPQRIWPPNMAGWWFTTTHIWPPNMAGWWFTTMHMATKHGWVMIYHTACGHQTWLGDDYHNAYGHQTWLGDNLPWQDPNHHDHVAFRDQAAN